MKRSLQLNQRTLAQSSRAHSQRLLSLALVAYAAMGCSDKSPSETPADAGQRTDSGRTSDAELADASADAIGDDAAIGNADSGDASASDGSFSGDADGVDGGAPDSGFNQPSGNACADATRVGDFTVLLSDTYTAVSGAVQDKVFDSIDDELVGSEGGCQLIKHSFPFCDPLCAAGTACTVDSTCEDEPVSVNLGTAHITGLKKAVTMMPVQPGNRYFNVDLPVVGFVPNAQITLTTSGGERDPLSLSGIGVSMLSMQNDVLTLTHGEALVVEWDTVERGQGRVLLSVNVDQHGTSPVTLECEVEDTGSHTIAASLIDQLLDSGVTGFPTGQLRRESVDSVTDNAGCIEFIVASKLLAKIEVTDHTPCLTPDDCTKPGETCNVPINTCVPE